MRGPVFGPIFMFAISFVGRIGNKLLTQADAAQIVAFKDPGQSVFGRKYIRPDHHVGKCSS